MPDYALGFERVPRAFGILTGSWERTTAVAKNPGLEDVGLDTNPDPAA